MVLKGLFNKIQRGPSRTHTNLDNYVELEVPENYEGVSSSSPPREIKVCKLKSFADIDISTRDLSRNNVVILDIKPLAERNMRELKMAIDEIKEIVDSMDGDIAGLTEYHLILTPPSMKIDRGRKEQKSGFEESMERVKGRTANV